MQDQDKTVVTNSSFAEGWLMLDGKPFRFDDVENGMFRPYLKTIYDTDYKKILLMFARQCEKSTTIGNRLITRSCLNTYHKSLYVTPTQIQTRVFVDDKLDPALDSPIIKELYRTGKNLTDKIEEKELSNGSKIWLRYAFLTADRTRGITVKDLYIDELQDIIVDNIPIIQECSSHFPIEKRELFSGTPKTYDSAINYYWEKSSQNEWMIKCSGCNKWNMLGIKNIGLKGPICANCGKIISPKDGQWVSMKKDSIMEGFRVCQLMVPWIYTTSEGWSDILNKRDTYPHSKLMNEVLSLPFDYGDRPITEEDMRACCNEQMLEFLKSRNMEISNPVFAGIDLGTGAGDNPSFTVLTIIQQTTHNHTKVIFMKKYEGQEIDPNHQLKDIVGICNRFGVNFIGLDWGMSWMFRSELRRHFPVENVVTFEYSHSLSAKFRWKRDTGTFIANRTENMTDMIHRIKQRSVEFPSFECIKKFSPDFTSIISDTDSRGHLIYNHPTTQPDDSFHSVNYAFMAMDIFYNRRKYLQGPDYENS